MILPKVRMVVRKFFKGSTDADDIIQESTLKIIRNIGKFSASGKFDSWVAQVTHRVCLNALRSMKSWSRRIETEIDLSIFPEEQENMIEEMDLDQFSEKVIEEMKRLPKRQREAFFYRVFMDKSFEEVANAMGCPYDTAKANYRHAFLKLKDALATSP